MNKSLKKYLSEIGKKGGSSTSEAKKRASRENGKLAWAKPKPKPAPA